MKVGVFAFLCVVAGGGVIAYRTYRPRAEDAKRSRLVPSDPEPSATTERPALQATSRPDPLKVPALPLLPPAPKPRSHEDDIQADGRPSVWPAAPQDIAAARKEAVATLERSGRASTPETAKAQIVLRDIRGTLENDLLRFGSVECYAGGCTSEMTVNEPSAFPNQQRTVGRELKKNWPGMVYVSGGENTRDGRVVASVIVYTGEPGVVGRQE